MTEEAKEKIQGEHLAHESVGVRVRRLRKERDLKQRDLAKAVGVAVQSISELERGTTKSPKPEHVFKLAGCLGVNPLYLVTGKGPREPFKEITPSEAELLVLFRGLDEIARADLIGYARGLQRGKTPFTLVTSSSKE